MHGLDEQSGKGMDEVSTVGPTHVAELNEDKTIKTYDLRPEDFGIQRARFEDVASSRDVHKDALALLKVLAGKDKGPRYDIVCLNAAPLLYATDKAKDLRAGLEMAREAVTDGRALKKLRDWVSWQNETPEKGLPTLEKMLAQI